MPRVYKEDSLSKNSQNKTLQYTKLTGHVIFNFNNNMSTAALFWMLKEPMIPHDTLACCLTYLHRNFRQVWSSLSAIFLHNANFVFRLKTKCLRQRKCKQWWIRFCSVHSFVQHVHNWYVPNTWCSFNPLFRRQLSVYHKSQGGFCCHKTQHVLSSMKALCERWNIKISEDKSHGSHLSQMSTSRDPSYSEMLKQSICKWFEIYRCKLR